MSSYEEKINKIMKDPSASFWLKDALRSTMTRDSVDAFRDAQVLSNILKEKVEYHLRRFK